MGRKKLNQKNEIVLKIPKSAEIFCTECKCFEGYPVCNIYIYYYILWFQHKQINYTATCTLKMS